MKIEQIALSVFDVAQAGYNIYIATAKAMDSIEIEDKTGVSKRAWVLAYIKGAFEEVANNWAYWSELLIKFINSIKQIYNILK